MVSSHCNANSWCYDTTFAVVPYNSVKSCASHLCAWNDFLLSDEENHICLTLRIQT